MTNLQKMFKGDLAAADKWVANTCLHTTCERCQIQNFCCSLEEGVYDGLVTCIHTHLRWLLEEAVDEPAFKEVSKPSTSSTGSHDVSMWRRVERYWLRLSMVM